MKFAEICGVICFTIFLSSTYSVRMSDKLNLNPLEYKNKVNDTKLENEVYYKENSTGNENSNDAGIEKDEQELNKLIQKLEITNTINYSEDVRLNDIKISFTIISSIIGISFGFIISAFLIIVLLMYST